MNAPAGERFIGASVTRLEDEPLVRGSGLFAADVSFPAQLHMRVVRSPAAHALIRAVATETAAAMPGVVAVWTSRDVDQLPPIDFRDDRVEKLVPYRQHVLAQEQVRYVGEPVAAVFANDPYRAEDAAEAVTLELDALPPQMAAREELRRRQSGLPLGPCHRRARPLDRPAFCGAAGDARGDRAL
jgi:carbon-monoxide dehydrogenase large subunit/6-hydroxypseudooxynicotine dehydrogenase subunit gamma